MSRCPYAFVLIALLAISSKSFAADLMLLDKGRTVHFAMVGHGPLCDANVQERSPDVVSVRLLKTTYECGHKGRVLRISKDQVLEILPEEHLSKERIAAKVLLALGGVAALAAIPLRSSDPESWLILANGVVPGFVAYAGWNAVSLRRDYVILLICPDSLHCF